MKNFLDFLFLIILIIFTSSANAQITFERWYGGVDDDRGFSVCETFDGNYIIAGYTMSYGAGLGDMYVIKVDSFGDTLWTNTYGGFREDYGYSIIETSDSCYLISGHTLSIIPTELYLVKIDTHGDTLWTKIHGWSGLEWGYEVHETADKGFIIAGWATTTGPGFASVCLVKTDSLGEMLWAIFYGGIGWDHGQSVCETSDGGYLVVGYTTSFGAGGYDLYLIRTNATGDTLWTRTYGGADDDAGCSITRTSDGYYVIAGWTESFGQGWSDVYLLKVDSLGDTLWTRTYGGMDYDRVFSVCEVSDGNFIVAGWTRSFGAGSGDVYLIKADTNGDTLWTRTYGGINYDQALSIKETSDGGFIICGYSASFGSGDYDVYLIKTDEFGNVGIHERNNAKEISPCLDLLGAQPNPFKEKTVINYCLRNSVSVSPTLKIYDATGRLIRTFVNWEQKEGKYHVIWNGKNERGSDMKSGVYFCNLRVGDYAENQWERIVLLR